MRQWLFLGELLPAPINRDLNLTFADLFEYFEDEDELRCDASEDLLFGARLTIMSDAANASSQTALFNEFIVWQAGNEFEITQSVVDNIAPEPISLRITQPSTLCEQFLEIIRTEINLDSLIYQMEKYRLKNPPQIVLDDIQS
jgi:hypothetical protein